MSTDASQSFSLGLQDTEQFRSVGQQVLDYAASYFENIRNRPPCPNVKAGDLSQNMADCPPEDGISWEEIRKDLENRIVPGMCHFQHPNNHAIFPVRTSHQSILAQILVSTFNGMTFSWSVNPSGVELEVTVMNWLVKLLGLPDCFLFSEDGKGGGSLQESGSDCVILAMVAARHATMQEVQRKNPQLTTGQILDKLVAYSTEQAHSSVKQAAQLCLVRLTYVPIDQSGAMITDDLEKAISFDKANGNIPFFVASTVGTTSMCAFDNISDIGSICATHGLWLHCDAAYAGTACVCPEFRYLTQGVELCTSFATNPYKWMGVSRECAVLWFKDTSLITNALTITPPYLKTYSDSSPSWLPEFRHWQFPTARSFNALKLWMVLSMTGAKVLRAQVRKDVGLAKQFEQLLLTDPRFEIITHATLSVVCFRLKGENSLTKELFSKLNNDHRLFLTPSSINGCDLIRFVISSSITESKDIDFAWNIIREFADGIVIPLVTKVE